MAVRRSIAALLGPLGGALAVGFGGLVVGAVLALAAVFGLGAIGVPIQEDLGLLVGVSVVMQGIGFALAALSYLRYRGLGIDYLRIRRPTLRDVGWTVLGLAGLLGLLALINLALLELGLQDAAEHELVALAEEHPRVLLWLVPLSILVIGPGEELLFRGVVQTRLVEAYGTGVGIVATSVVFALAHLPAYGGDAVVVAIASLFVLSLALGTVYEVTDNLVVPAVVHGLYNAILFGALYVYLTTELAV